MAEIRIKTGGGKIIVTADGKETLPPMPIKKKQCFLQILNNGFGLGEEAETKS